nr:dihydrofolate reductase family protein [Streptomyces sp. S3(2020)]
MNPEGVHWNHRLHPTATRAPRFRPGREAGGGRSAWLRNRSPTAGSAHRDRDVRIAGGGATILEYLNANLVDEFSVTLSPVLLGAGTSLFGGVEASRVRLEPVRSQSSPRVTHLTYTVHPR